ncbi:hypothetical protein M409DRAFT_51640 [Zasmidium cellare ATCC 36951]|uniref:DUF7730 domain-containing protein n=1 Tax=Zasmidium cellare ATCC 36951 TaxID=1080233 RepID=A0A6A6CU05_ZASCE|nr:uncharacterized protein M409DRAFT_51640 [Zasmidium cellare ATCC 36951]KAF2170634.1 hypothetical protein M409DRAFT_51640 [Zasmidium cellare ATCC 36951]
MQEETYHAVGSYEDWEDDEEEESDGEGLYYPGSDQTSSPRGAYTSREMFARPSHYTRISSDCDPQSQAPLFRLPPELRACIYDYVVGSGTIHVTTRSCTFMDRYLTAGFGHQMIGDWNGPEGETFQKSTYSVCSDGNYWKEAYARSKLGEFDYRRDLRHMGPCARAADDLQDETLATILLQTSMRPKGDAGWRQFRADHDDRLSALKQRHARSALDLNLLQTCRLIYQEAWKLPFLNYTYDIPGELQRTFVSKVLFQHQASAIQSLRVDELLQITDLNYMLGEFPSLKKLQIMLLTHQPIYGLESHFRTFFSLSKIESVQGILTCVSATGYEAKPAEAEQMEKFLVKTENRGRGLARRKEISERVRAGIEQGLCVIDGYLTEDSASDNDDAEDGGRDGDDDVGSEDYISDIA